MISIRLLPILLSLIIASIEANPDKQGKHKHGRLDINENMWKNEYEAELSDATLGSRKVKNSTRTTQSFSKFDDEVVIEKLMESITANEKYLKKIESIDFRLNRLDVEVHDKTNAILKRLTEIATTADSQGYFEKLDTALDALKADVGQIKFMFEKYKQVPGRSDGIAYNSECQLETTLDSRISLLESNMKSVKNNVESIANVISEVKNRQRSPNSNKPEIVSSDFDGSSLINEFRRVIQEQKSRKCNCKSGRVDRSERYPTDCQEIQTQGFNITGIYKIQPEQIEPFYALCDLNIAGGGWTVIQNRFDGSQEFFKSWLEYKHGFGNLAGEFWLGLEKIYHLTNQKLYELRVEMESQHGQEGLATYSVFILGPEYEGYRISTIGSFRGTAGDSLSYHAGQKFSTYDLDNDDWKEGSCAIEHGGAWWYKECDKSNLNGKYLNAPDENSGQSIYWISFKGPSSPISKTRMMIRPLPASRPMEYNEKARISASSQQSSDKKRGKEMVRGPVVPYRGMGIVRTEGDVATFYSGNVLLNTGVGRKSQESRGPAKLEESRQRNKLNHEDIFKKIMKFS